jgi:hypothetical protein
MVVPPPPTTTTTGDAAAATVTAPTFTPRPWFGGAMSASLPATFLDASDVRPVPDHQEVWHDSGSAGAAAVMVEIVEHDAEGVSDAQAGAHFFADAAEGAGAAADTSLSSSSTFSREVDPASLPAPRMPGERPTAAREGAFVVGASPGGMLLAAAIAVFRIPRVASDIVITSFEPVGDGAAAAATTTATSTTTIEAAAAGAVAVARQRLARVVETVQVNDWGLFGGGGD